MPRFVRPSWIEVNIEGRARFASGPKSKAGCMFVQFKVRDNGSVSESVRIETMVVGNKQVLTVYNEDGQVIHNHVTELD